MIALFPPLPRIQNRRILFRPLNWRQQRSLPLLCKRMLRPPLPPTNRLMLQLMTTWPTLPLPLPPWLLCIALICLTPLRTAKKVSKIALPATNHLHPFLLRQIPPPLPLLFHLPHPKHPLTRSTEQSFARMIALEMAYVCMESASVMLPEALEDLTAQWSLNCAPTCARVAAGATLPQGSASVNMDSMAAIVPKVL